MKIFEKMFRYKTLDICWVPYTVTGYLLPEDYWNISSNVKNWLCSEVLAFSTKYSIGIHCHVNRVNVCFLPSPQDHNRLTSASVYVISPFCGHVPQWHTFPLSPRTFHIIPPICRAVFWEHQLFPWISFPSPPVIKHHTVIVFLSSLYSLSASPQGSCLQHCSSDSSRPSQWHC